MWLLDGVARSVLIFRRSAPRAPAFDVALELAVPDALHSPLLPGFSAAIGDIFAR